MKLLFCNNHFARYPVPKKAPMGGAWIQNLIEELSSIHNYEISVVLRGDKYSTFERNNIKYFILPVSWFNKEAVAQKYLKKVLELVNPDILHIEGTEMAFASDLFLLNKGKSIISIQGLIEGISYYEMADLSLSKNLRFNSFRGFIILCIVHLNFQLRFKRRLKKELVLLTKGKYFLGRTLWDRAHVKAHNPLCIYFDCPRIISNEFYKKNWKLSILKKDVYSVFIGNCSTPRKGLHIAIKALEVLVMSYPNINFRIAGHAPKNNGNIRYLDFINIMIDKKNLRNSIEFTGPLERIGMAQELEKCDLYLLPSLIENSPNTLAEAMIVGVPIVAAAAGGIPSMIRDEQEGLLYRPEDYQMAALQISRLLKDQEFASRLGKSAQTRALKRHDNKKIVDNMILTYGTVLND